jgi:hypothetical protein
MTKFILGWEARGFEDQVVCEIRCGDALSDEIVWPQGADLVLMNPPFRSWRDMTPAQQSAVRRVLGEHAHLRPDLSTAFLWRASESLGGHAALASVLPASFLDGESFRSIRAQLSERLVTRLIARLGSHDLFHEARVDAAFYVAGAGIEADVPLALWADHRLSSNSAALRALRRARMGRGASIFPVVQDGFSIYPNQDIGRGSGSWAPRPYRNWRLLQRARDLPHVSDSFSVQQGTITGFNRVFLMSRLEWEHLPEAERPYFRPCVLNDSIRSGKLYDDAYVFYPYGAAAIEDEKELKIAVPTFYRHRLGPNKKALAERRRTKAERWWLLSEHRAWQVQPVPKMVSAYFGDAGAFAWDETGEFVVVQGYGWLPRSKRGLGRSAWLAYLALVNSRIFSLLLAASSNHVGGGQWNLSKRFVEPIPLPCLADEAVDTQLIGDLAALGEVIRDSGLAGMTGEERRRFADLTETAYALPAPG